MPATFTWCEQNGAATGSPAHGTTSFESGATDVNWKNIDDCTANSGTAYSSSPLSASSNSFTKYTYGKFSGTFSSISGGLFAHTSGTLGTNLTLKSVVTSTYATPATTTNASLTTDSTSAISIGSGATVLFSVTSPQAASPTTSITAAGYTQFCATQMQVGASPIPGDTATCVLTIEYLEN